MQIRSASFHLTSMAAPLRRRPATALVPAVALALLAAAGAAWAERADRSKPMTLESDKPCTVSLARQVSACSGNVVLTQGTLVLRAERLELRETPEGYQVAQAIGADGKPASYRQKRDGLDEYVEGQAQRIDYDGRSQSLRLSGQAVVRRLRGSTVADEIQGGQILWDAQAEQFSVLGQAAGASAPSGRVRAVIAPRVVDEAPAAAPAAPAASVPLRSSPALGERR